MLRDPHKNAIRENFSRAAANYDAHAQLQRRIADALLEYCPEHATKILDAGCGTGYSRKALQARSAHYLALDLALGMLAPHAQGICADLEQLPLADESIDCYFSSLAWQWTDSRRASAEALRVLQPDGTLVVATMGPASLHEIRRAFLDADHLPHVRHFDPAEKLRLQLQESGFSDITIDQQAMQTHAPDLRTLLHGIKAMGARVVGTPRSSGLYGVQRFRRAIASYEQMREPAGLPMTYDVIFIRARKGTVSP